MRKCIVRAFFAVLALLIIHSLSAQTRTNVELLRQASVTGTEQNRMLQQQLAVLAKEKGWELFIRSKKTGSIAMLVGVDPFGLPLYHITGNNIIAAATIGTNKLWPGGSTGLNLSGASANMKDKLAFWEVGGKPLSTHVELNGRILSKDASTTVSDHATHVAGTLIASGVNPLAKGMSYGLQELLAFDASNDAAEMQAEAANNLLVSNHSYATIAGWNYNETQVRWEFLGRAGENEDYKFGYYSQEAQVYDSIVYNAPFYLIVKSAGNNRSVNGPNVGESYYRYDGSGVMNPAGNRPATISSNDSYDIIAGSSLAKNILTVGAVNPISTGYTRPDDVVMSSFSNWGPTDDGRIKPDVVADGVNVFSSVSGSNNAYAALNGTSMAAPNASGSLFLLQEYYAQLHSGTFMRAATLKGIAIHTADEAGAAPGPDYEQGWGLLNMQKAAAVITANNTTHLIQQNVLNNGSTYSFNVVASGKGTITATLCWTDPKAAVDAVNVLDNPTPKLVNDLDIVIKKGATVYYPWKLNPAFPAQAAARGDNTLDNVEKIELTDVVPGDTYTIEIKHKGTLQRGSQAYSLIVSGVGGAAYCTSGATSSAGARIDSVSFSNVQQKNPTTCDTYDNFTNVTGNIQPGETIPFFIRLRTCSANAAKIAKVYIDANNDGDFSDAGENPGTSGIINGDGDINMNITIPGSLTPGTYSIIRVVMVETSDPATITPCNTYTSGATQDYRVLVIKPSTDIGVSELVAPAIGECQTGEQYLSVRIRNYGTTPASNIPVTAVIKQGAATVATLNGTFAGTILAGGNTEYTFQTPFVMAANTTYSFTITATTTGDQLSSNNELATTITTSPAAAAPAGTATICGTTATLRATSTSTTPFNWYTSAAAATAFATGNLATTNTLQSTYYLSTGEVNKKLGAASKMAFTSGGYTTLPFSIRFTTSMATTLKTARLYFGASGKVTFSLRKLISYNENDGTYFYYDVASKTVDAIKTHPGTPSGNDPSDPGTIINLDLTIPEAGDFMLRVEASGGATIFRNTGITTTNYPYDIPGIISLTGNNSVQTGNPNFYQSVYYFLYDIAVRPVAGCPSPRTAITAVTATAPAISAAGNVLTSTAAASYQWYLNGSPLSGANSQSYTATASGSYTVEVTYSNGCTFTSAAFNFSVTAVPNIDPSGIGLVVSPNPSNGQFTIKLETRTKADLDISLVNTTGQRVYHTSIPGVIGQFTKTIQENKLAAGLYYLRIFHDKKMYIYKVAIAQ